MHVTVNSDFMPPAKSSQGCVTGLVVSAITIPFSDQIVFQLHPQRTVNILPFLCREDEPSPSAEGHHVFQNLLARIHSSMAQYRSVTAVFDIHDRHEAATRG